MRKDRLGLSGVALIVGGLMFFVFWVFPATEAEVSLIGPWPLQLAFHGVQIITLTTGLVLVSRLPVTGWARHVWRVGAVVAAIGTPLGLPLFAAGILLMGVSAMSVPELRVAAAPMVPGAMSWIVLFSQGAMVGNEDYPPLTGPEQVLAVAGLVLIATGLMLLGALVLRLRAGDPLSRGASEKQPEHAGRDG